MQPSIRRHPFWRLALMVLAASLLLISEKPSGAITRRAAARVVAPTFYEGTLTGGDIQDWTLWISVSGKASFGLMFGTGGPAPGDQLIAARLEGTAKKKGRSASIDLKIYAIGTGDSGVRIGRLVGASQAAGGYAGTFSLAGRTGTFSVTTVSSDPTRVSALSGRYTDTDGNLSLNANLLGDGSFEITGEAWDRPFGKATGFWTVDSAGYLWLLPTSILESNEFFDLTIKLRVPLKMRVELDGNEASLYDPISDDLFATLTKL